MSLARGHLSGNTPAVTIDEQVRRHYELHDEAQRLWQPGLGTLTRLRTWDIFDRHLPPSGRVADVGGGPGTHARHLAERGYEVVLVDPLPRHVEQAARTGAAAGVSCLLGDARALPLPDASAEAVLMLGPLYHLVEASDRGRALAEALRVLRPGGRLVAEAITRHAWIVDAASQGLLGQEGIWETFELNLRCGLSNDPQRVGEGVFWGYFHRPDELAAEVGQAGFGDVRLLAVEGFAGLLGNLDELLKQPDRLLRAIRLTECEPSMLGVSAHVVAVAAKPLA